MKIRRSGARAHHGYSSVDLSDCSISWDDDDQALVLRSRNVRDFSTDAHHDYEVAVPISDFNAMVDTLAEELSAGGAEATLVGLSASLRGMLRIVAAEVGLLPPFSMLAGEEQDDDLE